MSSIDTERQTTIAGKTAIAGVGLHTGAECRVLLSPAAAGSGVRFFRSGVSDDPIVAHVDHVTQTRLGTSIRNASGIEVRTVEHLLAAAVLSGADNLDVEIEGPEIPIVDGSAAPFCDAIESVGLIRLDAPRRVLRIDKAVALSDAGRRIEASPGRRRLLNVRISFPDAAIGEQEISVDLDDAATRRRIACARTFCRKAEIDAMRSAGFALGGSLENSIVVDGAEILNPGGLRDPAEFALHKALDLVGDLALAGLTLFGRVDAVRPGHDLNIAFARHLLSAYRAAPAEKNAEAALI